MNYLKVNPSPFIVTFTKASLSFHINTVSLFQLNKTKKLPFSALFFCKTSDTRYMIQCNLYTHLTITKKNECIMLQWKKGHTPFATNKTKENTKGILYDKQQSQRTDCLQTHSEKLVKKHKRKFNQPILNIVKVCCCLVFFWLACVLYLLKKTSVKQTFRFYHHYFFFFITCILFLVDEFTFG